MKQKIKQFEFSMIQKKRSNNGWKFIFTNNIIFEIHLWHCFVIWNQTSPKLKTLHMHLSFDQCYKIVCIIWINGLKYFMCVCYDKVNGYQQSIWDLGMFNNPIFLIINMLKRSLHKSPIE
jgi:hypothetical protein